MKCTYRSLCRVGLLLFVAHCASADDKMWVGRISDSKCTGSHANVKAVHADLKWSDHDCTNACVKAGAKFVLVSRGNVYRLSNQDDSKLAEYAGSFVKITGSIKGDMITSTTIDPAGVKDIPPKDLSDEPSGGER